jgi:hypothetical protein
VVTPPADAGVSAPDAAAPADAAVARADAQPGDRGAGADVAAPVPASLRSPHAWTISTYFAEGFPYSVVNNLADLFFTEQKATLQQIGLTSMFHLPWNLKFFLGPFVDAYATKRRWLIGVEVLLTLALIGLRTYGSIWRHWLHIHQRLWMLLEEECAPTVNSFISLMLFLISTLLFFLVWIVKMSHILRNLERANSPRYEKQ